MTIKSEAELLKIVRNAIEGGLAPLLRINGEYYDIDLTYLMTNGDRCSWWSNGKCGLDECKFCSGTQLAIDNCDKLWKGWDE